MVTKIGVCLETKPRCIFITKVMGGVHLHVRTCARAAVPPFRISEMARRIALKFGVWLVAH